MQIRMLTTSAGPCGVRGAGKVFDVDDSEGVKLVKGGFAVPLKGARSERAVPAVARSETAVVESKSERADEGPTGPATGKRKVSGTKSGG